MRTHVYAHIHTHTRIHTREKPQHPTKPPNPSISPPFTPQSNNMRGKLSFIVLIKKINPEPNKEELQL